MILGWAEPILHVLTICPKWAFTHPIPMAYTTSAPGCGTGRRTAPWLEASRTGRLVGARRLPMIGDPAPFAWFKTDKPLTCLGGLTSIGFGHGDELIRCLERDLGGILEEPEPCPCLAP